MPGNLHSTATAEGLRRHRKLFGAASLGGKRRGSPPQGEGAVRAVNQIGGDLRSRRNDGALSPRAVGPTPAAVKLNEDEEATDNPTTARRAWAFSRCIPELESIRSVFWTRWNSHPNSDIDVYQMLMDCRPDFLRPHVITIGRQGQPEAMLVGRIVQQSVEFKFGYKTILNPNVRVLNIVQGGLWGTSLATTANSLLEKFGSLCAAAKQTWRP